MPLRLLVTRPEPDATRTAAALRDRGHTPMLAPLLRFEPIADAQIGHGPWGGLLTTSAAAARAAGQQSALAKLRDLPALTVGRRTAEEAREVGFTNVASADGDTADLVRLAVKRFAKQSLPLLYLAGEDRAADLAGALATQGIAVHTVVVYRMVAAVLFPDDVQAALLARRVDGVLHYSKRTAETYLRCAAAAGLRAAALAPIHYCLSTEIAAVLTAGGAEAARNAGQPDELSLLNLIG